MSECDKSPCAMLYLDDILTVVRKKPELLRAKGNDAKGKDLVVKKRIEIRMLTVSINVD